MRLIPAKFLALAGLLASAPVLPALAHAPKTGSHGGPQTDAGPYHVELVASGTTLELYLRSHADQPVTTAGFKGTAILVVDGKPQRITLEPQGDRLTGTSPVSLPAALKGAVQLTTPNGSTASGKFN
ncbi:conserved hypothetical protein [Methylobacterium sp. 4-46]|uniref:hypothetical protein n=1 Tax=unclassified Methylobacterium TaxID=2615210 RepID=UPI000152D146|nr:MULTISPECIES: hypothetical protein [Methylobacterium]ACA14758.1 conserved hypothetical protein [Methylobacterium sp. 4-46]WFT80510.1 hypothetical protein QA634_00920 [Methylobacterium nodulans]